MSDTPQKDRIGDYELLALIGDGAQGRVYKARYAPLGAQTSGAPAPDSPTSFSASDLSSPGQRTAFSQQSVFPSDDVVALKVVRITGEDEKLRIKFQEQADILRRLSHPSIVAYRDCFSWHAGEWDESQCLVMELLEGESLHERLKNAKSGLPWPQVEEIFEQCLAGLIHARERGITHRDLKPSNIFITKEGKAKLIDFDIARRDDSGQMSTAGWKGTFDYMAPDFITINGFRGDEVSDIYSLGVCFYQALTGTLPYEPLGETAHIGYLNRWRDNASPTPSFRPGVFRVLSNAKTLVARCLAARREQRYPSFTAMLAEFRTIRYRRIRHKGKEEYELLAVLGRGGFGEVFKGRRVSDGLLVAVKYLFSEKQSERFVKEAKILQQYPHPNLVKYVDFMVIEGTAGEKQFFLVMEFLEGMPGWTLRPRLKNEGRLEVTEAVPLFSAYLSALQFLHENARPIIHRDIKPGNLYAPAGQPEKGKIFDLGIARDVSGTVTVGGVPGTLDYMAPEFAEAGGDRGTPQSDLYALGLCLYEALAGKPVYDRLPSDLNSAWLAFQDRLRKPLAITFDAPAFSQYPGLKQVITKALSDKPEGRFRSAAEMRKTLLEALQPATLHPAHDDGFEDAEVTMATCSPGRPHADPDTLGTRPLAPADLPEALAAIRAKEAAPKPPFRHLARFLLIGGGIAALLLLTFGSFFLGLKGRKDQAPATSTVAQPSVAPSSDLRPPSSSPSAPTPEEVAAAKAKQEEAAAAAKIKQAEALAAKVKEDEAAAEKIKQAAAVAQAREDAAAADKIKQAAAAAKAKEEEALASKAREDEAAAKARLAEAAKANELSALAARTKELSDAAARLDTLPAAPSPTNALTHSRTNELLSILPALQTLAAFTPSVLADPGVKAKWSAARAACAARLEKGLAQKEPLGQRAERLKTVEDTLAAPAAAQVLSDLAAGLRKSLDAQKSVSLLRLVNPGADAVTLSANEFQGKIPLAAGKSDEWSFPVPGDTLTLSVTVDGGSRFRARTETLKLPRAGGLEYTLAPLEAVAVVPVVPPAASVPAAATNAVSPSSALRPPSSPSLPPTSFIISVSPKTAAILMDDKPVQPGPLVVTPNENHKISATCPGYKPVQQYYKARPGETRKIDILLEKLPKKGLFGF